MDTYGMSTTEEHVKEEAPEEHIPELTIARRLYLARDETGLNQAEFAARIGVSRRSIVNYESGSTHPNRPVLLSWSLATGVPLEWFEQAPDYSPRIHGPAGSVQLNLFGLAA